MKRIQKAKVSTALAWAPILSLGLAACGRGTVDSNLARRDGPSGKVDIVRHYSLVHSEATGQSLFTANFREGSRFMSADVRLLAPASIHVNGKALSEDSLIDRQDGGEIAAFYLGFLYPPAWFLIGDDGYVNYVGRFPGEIRSFQVVFRDPENEVHEDHFSLPSASFEIPQLARRSRDLDIRVANEHDSGRASCDVEYEKVILKATAAKPNGDTPETSSPERTIVKTRQTYLADFGKVRIPAADLREAVSDHMMVQCAVTISRSLSSGRGGSVSISSVGTSHRIDLVEQ